MKSQVLAVVLIVCVLIGAAAGYVVGSGRSAARTLTTTLTTVSTNSATLTATSISSITLTRSEASYSTVTSTQVSESTTVSTVTSLSTLTTYATTPALLLQVSLNTTELSQGHSLLASFSLSNPLPENVTFAPSYINYSMIQWWNTLDFICPSAGSLNSVWSFALYPGHVTPQNFSFANPPFTLAPPLTTLLCPLTTMVTSLRFLPNSDTALVNWASPLHCPCLGLPVEFNTNATTSYCYGSGCTDAPMFGYWNLTATSGITLAPQNATTSSKYFVFFPPGNYTLIVADAWGQTIYSYFQVVPKQ